MNKVYRVIWNESLGAWVAVSEITKSKGKKSNKAIKSGVLVSSLVLFAGNAIAAELALGGGTATAGTDAIAIGQNANATKVNSGAIGPGAEALGDDSFAVGTRAKALANYSTALGNQATAEKEYDLAVGYNTIASGGQSTAVGYAASSTGKAANAIGGSSLAEGEFSTAVGQESYADAKATQALAVGYRSKAFGEQSTAVGYAAKSTGFAANAIGGSSLAEGEFSTAVGQESYTDKKATQALAVGYKSKALNEQSTAVGFNSISTGFAANAIGGSSLAEGKFSTAVGQQAHAKADFALAVGYNNKALGEQSTAVGFNSISAGYGSNAIGSSSLAKGNHSTAIGTSSAAEGDHSIAIGQDAKTATGEQFATALGFKANASGRSSFAQGSLAEASGGGSIAIGDSSKATTNDTIAIGVSSEANLKNSVALGIKSKTSTNAVTVTSAKVGDITYGGFAGTVSSVGSQISVGDTGNERQIKHVAAGAISDKSTDAINGSQLFFTQTALGNLAASTAKNLGGGASVAPDGSVTSPTYIVTNNPKTPGTKVTAHTVGEALSALDSAVNVPLVFKGNTGNDISKKLGDTLSIKGDLANAGAATATNLRVDEENGELKIKLARNLTDLDSVTVGGPTGPSITTNGINAGDKKITNVAAGDVSTTSKDAINGSQLNTVKETAEKGWNFTATNGSATSTADTVKPGETLDFANTDGNIGITSANNKLTFNLAKDIKVDSVTAGGTVVKNDGITIVGGPSVTKTGIDAGDKKITNVEAGTGDKDAVNVSQLKAAKSTVKEANGIKVDPTQNADGSTTYTVSAKTDGTTTKIDNNGNIAAVTAPLTTNTDGKVNTPAAPNALATAGDIANAINNSGWKATSGATGSGVVNGTTEELINPSETVKFQAGDNMVLNQAGNVFTYSLNKDININSVQFNNGPKITNDGNNIKIGDKDGNATKITNVAAGTATTDGVNVSQLKPVVDALGGGSAINTDGTIKAPSYTVNNATVNNVGDAIKALDKGWTVNSNGKLGTGTAVKAGDSVDIGVATGEQNLTTTAETKNGTTVIGFALAKDLKVDSVNAGGTVINNNGLSFVNDTGAPIANTPSIKKTGIDAGGQQIANVASGGNTSTNAANIGDVQKAAAAAKSVVVAGTNVASVSPNVDSNTGATTYTVNAKGTKVTGSNAVTVTQGVPDANNVTDYAVDLSQTSKNSLVKADTAVQSLTTAANGANAQTLNQSSTQANFKDGKNIKVTGNATGITIATADEVTFDKVTVDGVVVDGGKITGLSAGNVSPTSSDAVNGSQLYNTSSSVANALGGGSVVNPDGTVKAPSYTVNNVAVNNVGDAITALDKGWTVNADAKLGAGQAVKAGDSVDIGVATGEQNLTTTAKTANGKTVIDFALAKDLKVDSVNAGGTVINNNGLSFVDSKGATLANTPSIKKDGIDAGGNKITNVADGDVSTTSKDAINGSQLNTVKETAEKGWKFTATNGTTISAADTVKPGETLDFANTDGNIGITSGDNKLTFNLAKDIKVDSVTAGDTVVNNNSLTVGGANKVTVDGKTGIIKGLTNTTWDPNATYTGGQAATQEQLKSAGDQLTTKGLNFAGNQGANIHKNLGDTLLVKGSLDNTAAASSKNLRVDEENGELKIKLARDLTDLDSVTVGGPTGPSITTNGINAGDKKITNVAAGDVSTTSKDAVNGSQLNAVKETANKGWNLTTNGKTASKSNVKPGDTVDFANTDSNVKIENTGNNVIVNLNKDINLTDAGSVTIGDTKLNNNSLTVGGANKVTVDGKTGIIKGLTNTTWDPNATYTGGQAATQEQLKSAGDQLTTKGLNFAGNQGANIHKNLGDTLLVKGSLDNTAAASSKNLRVDEENGELKIKLARDLTDLDSVTVGGPTGPSITTNGINAGDKKITNVAAGDVSTTSKDAVNGSQLNAVKETANKGWNLTTNGKTASKSNVKPGDTVDFANTDSNVKIENTGNNVIVNLNKDINLTDAGSVTIGDTKLNNNSLTVGGANKVTVDGKTGIIKGLTNTTWDPNATYTGGQAATQEQLKSAGDQLTTKGLNFAGNQGANIHKNLGDTLLVKGSLDNTAAASSKNLRVDEENGELKIKLARDLTDLDSVTVGGPTGPSITTNGINAGDKKITNVAAGDVSTTSKDAVNGSQLNAVKETANKGWNLTTNGKTASKSNVKPGDTVDFANTDSNVKIENTGNNVIVNLNKDINLTDAGSVTIGDTKLNNNSLTVGGANKVTVDGKTGIIKGLTNTTWDPNATYTGGQAATQEQLKSAGDQLTTKGLNFAGNQGANIHKNLGDTLLVKGSLDNTAAASSKNLRVDEENGELKIKLARDLTDLDSVTVGGPTGPSITTNGINAGDKKITNVAAGDVSTTSKDAVNGSQLNAVKETANKGWNLTTNGKTASKSNVKPGDTVDFANTDSNVKIENTGNNVIVNLNKDINLTDAGSVTIGDTKLNNNSLTVGGANKVTVDGKTGIIKGLTNTTWDPNATYTGGQAATQEQLKSAGDQLTTKGLNFAGNQGANIHKNLGDTLLVKGSLDNTAAASSKNLRVDEENGELKIKLARDLTDLDSVTVGGPTGPSITTNGINAGDKKITNVAAGDVSTTSKDAVNGSQLNAVKETANKGWNLTTNGKTASKSNVKPGDTVDFANTDSNVKIENTGNNVIVNLNKDINLTDAGSVTIGDTKLNNNSLTVGGANKVTVDGKTGIIKGLTNTTWDPNATYTGGQAATQEQLKSAGDQLTTKGLNFAGNQGANIHKNLGDTLLVKGSLDNTAAASSKNLRVDEENGELKIKLARNLTDLDSVTVGNTVLNPNGLTVGGPTGPSITTNGINAGGKAITNVNPGVNGTDAVNVNQLKAAKSTVKGDKGVSVTPTTNADGSKTYTVAAKTDNTTVKVDDKGNIAAVTAPLTTNTDGKVNTPAAPNALATAGDIANAINNSGWKATSGATGSGVVNGTTEELINPSETVKFQAGDNMVLNQAGNVFTYSLNKDININSVQIGANGPTIKADASNNIKIAKSDGSATKITNVEAGTGDKDAVNVSQLKNQETTLSNKGLDFVANSGAKVHKNLGDTLGVIGTGTKADSEYSGDNIKTITDANGNIVVQLDKNLTTDSVTTNTVTLNGKPGVNGQPGTPGLSITGAQGPAGVNGKPGEVTTRIEYNDGTGPQQVANLNDGLKFAGNQGSTINKKLNETLSIKGGLANADAATATNLRVDEENGELKIKLARDLTDLDSVTVGNTVLNPNGLTVGGPTGPSITTNGINAGGKAITNVNPGVNGTDAVNVNQLKAAKSTVKGDKGVSVTPTTNADGSKTYTVAAKTDNTTVKVDDKGNIAAVTAPLTTNTDGKVNTPAAPNALATAGDIANAINNSGWKLAADGTTGTELINPSDTVTFKTGSSNLTVKRDDANITYDLAKDININSVQIGANGPTIKADASNNIKIAKSDGSATKITNVEAGTGDKDAVNVSQLKNQETTLSNKGLDFVANSGAKVHKNLGDTLGVIGTGTKADSEYSGDNIKTITDANGNIVVQLDKNLTTDSVTTNTVTLNGQPGTPGISITGAQGPAGVNGQPGKTTTRIEYNDGTGPQQIANLNDGLKFAGNQGSTINKKLNETLSIKGGLANADAATATNLRVDEENGELKIKLARNLTDLDSVTVGNTVLNPNGLTVGGPTGPSITTNGINAGGKAITNVDPGVNGTDAVNVNQLKAAKSTVKGDKGVTVSPSTNPDGSTTYTVAAKTDGVTTQVDSNGNIAAVTTGLTNTGTGTVATPAAPNALVTANTVADAINNSGWKLAADGTTGTELINPSDTVTFKTGSSNLTVERDGANITYDLAKDININSVQIGANGPTIKADASNNINIAKSDGSATKITNVKAGEADTDAVNVSQLKNQETTLSNKGLDFVANSGAKVHKNLGDTLGVIGTGTKADSEYSGDNIKTITDANGNIVVQLDKNLTTDSVTTNTVTLNGKPGVNGQPGTPGISITGAQGPAGVNGQPGKTTTRIEYNDGTGPQQIANLNDGLKFAGNQGSTINKKLNETLSIKGGLANADAATATNLRVDEENGELKIKLARNLTDLDSVTVGNTVLNPNGLTVGGPTGPSITTNGINAGGKAITNVDPGVNGTDAVNVNQLKAAKSTVKGDKGVTVSPSTNPDGSTTYTVAAKTDGVTTQVDSNGNIAAVTTGLTNTGTGTVATPTAPNALATAGDIANAINNSGWKLAADGTTGTELINPSDTVTFKTGSSNLTVERDGANITYDLAKDININSVQIGANGPTIKADASNNINIAKSDGSATKITNVKAGEADTDAVNVSQLKNQETTLSNKGLDFVANSGAKVHKNLGDTLGVIGTGTKADSEYSGDNIKTITDANGNIVVQLDKNLTTDSVTTNTVTLNGKPGVNGQPGTPGISITGAQGPAGVNGQPGKTTTRIEYNDGTGPQQIANLNDGLKFAGNQGSTINKKLNETLSIKGGLANADAATATNLRVDEENGELKIKLARNLTDLDSVTVGNTVLNPNGLTVGGPTGPSITTNGINAGGKAITNVDPGVNGTDAVNVNQLEKAANNLVTTGFNIADGKGGKDNVKLGETVTFTDPAGNIITTVTDNKVEFGLNSTLSVGKDGEPGKVGIKGADGKDAISLNGKDGTIGINGKDGANATLTVEKAKPALDGKDGQNGENDQTRIVYTKPNGSKEEVATLNDGLNFKADDGSIVAKKLNETLEIVGGADKDKLTDNNIGVNNKNGKLTVQLAKDININSVKFGDNGPTIKADASNNINIAKSDGSATKITNVKAGEADTDAVNVSQLEKAQAAATTKVEEADGIKVVPTKNADGSTTYTVSAKTDGTTTTINADGKIAAVTTTFKPSTDGKVGAPVGNGDSLVTANTVADAINNSGWKATSGATGSGVVNGTTEELINPSETVTFRAGDNMVLNQAENVFTYSLNKDININSVQFNNGPKITNDGNNIKIGDKDGNATKITNVAAGTGDKDAVNVSQLKAVEATANKGWNLTTNGKPESKSNVKPGDTVDFANEDGNVKIENKGNNVIVNLNKDIDLTKDGSVTIGDTKVNNDGLTIAGGPSVTKSGIDAGDKKITNVAPGKISADSKDAINGSQLYTVQQAAVAAKTEVKAGDNVEVKKESGGNGQDIYTVSAKDTSASVTAGSTAVAVTKGATTKVGTTDVTDYKVDLSQSAKDDIKKGVDAKDIVDNKGLTFAGDSGSTSVQKLGSTVNVKGDKNITTKASGNTVEVALNPNVTVDSVTATQAVNVGSGGAQVALTTNVGKDGVRELSVGSANAPTRITNVARGVNDTDAVNLSQLKDLGYNINTKIDKVEKEANAGIASAMAMETAPFIAGKWTYAVGAAYYGGEQAVGATLRKTADNGRWSLTGGVATGTEGDPSVRIGISGVID